MIARKQVVLILGAGASMPYGFPSGGSLTDQICSEIRNPNGDYARDILRCGFDGKLAEDFRNQLSLSYMASVDAFLEHRHEFIEIGKTCIARSLIPCEVETGLDRGRPGHWYRYLFQRLNTTPESFCENKIGIITFNYDRSLEHFLFLAVQNSYGLSDHDAGSLVRSIPIIHLQGDLGKLPVLSGSGRPYEPTVTASILKQCAADIKIIHEDVVGDSQFTNAHSLIKEAEIACFLGFGFNRTNLERLSISGLWKNKVVYATTYQLPHNEIEGAREWFRHRFDNNIEAGEFEVIKGLEWWPILI